jgi:hypothetical protein
MRRRPGPRRYAAGPAPWCRLRPTRDPGWLGYVEVEIFNADVWAASADETATTVRTRPSGRELWPAQWDIEPVEGGLTKPYGSPFVLQRVAGYVV